MIMLKYRPRWHAAALVAGILFIAASLRVTFTAIAPILPLIQNQLGLSHSATGLLTSLPLLAFAAFSPLSASIARRFGTERTLFGALLIISAGVLVRSTGGISTLYAGTVMIGIGIALGNVLLPSLIKRDFSNNMASMTGAYSIIMGAAAAAGSAVLFPLSQVLGWHAALSLLICVPLAALVLWLPQLKKHDPAQRLGTQHAAGVSVWRSPLAWQVTLFMGCNSMPYYIAVSWLPTMLIEHGTPAEVAGSLHGMLQLTTALPGLVLAAALRRLNDQRALAVAVSVLSALSLTGFVLAPAATMLWSALLGFGCGASMMLGLTFIGLRTKTAGDAAALSGMAQCVGYLMAAAGPLVVGTLHDGFGGWTAPLMLTSAIALAGALVGWLAGRNRHIGQASDDDCADRSAASAE